MTEKQFENKVKEFLTKYQIWHLKTWSNGIQRKGVPDLLVCCNGFFIGVELKAKNGKPSDLQKWNIRKIRESNGLAIVLYPENFDDFKNMIIDLKYDPDTFTDWLMDQDDYFDGRWKENESV